MKRILYFAISLLGIVALASCEKEKAPKNDLIGTTWEEKGTAVVGWHHHNISFLTDTEFYYTDTGSRPSGASYFLGGKGTYTRSGSNITFNFTTDTKLFPVEGRIVNGDEMKLLSGTISDNKLTIKYTVTWVMNGADYETKEHESVLTKAL